MKDPKQKAADTDLLVILIATGLVLAAFTVWQSEFRSIVKDPNVPVLLRTVVAALAQFGVAGLGISVVSLWRRESFLGYGLRTKGLVPSIILSVLAFVPHIVFSVLTKGITAYLPFQSVWVTKDVLSSGFPSNVVGMLLITTAWGFFEGFNYVVISQKINTAYPNRNKYLNWGAISCALMCLLIHGLVGITFVGILESISVFIIIYGMLMTRDTTGNAWGSVFIFVFLWNAF